jgi:hypothetical protein
MRTTVGFVLSLVLAVGTLLLLVDSNDRSTRRRMASNSIDSVSPSYLRRKLWNYSSYRQQKQNGNSSSSNNKNSNGGSSSYNNKYSSNSNSGNNGYNNYNNGMNPNYSSNVYSKYSSNNSGSGNNSGNGNGVSQYGNNYANYNDNSSNNNNGNYDNQNYDNSNYIWQRDDDDNYKNDDTSYYNSNSNYKANGAYNGRDQYWGGQAVQNYDDDQGPQVTVEGMDDDEDQWRMFSKLGKLSAKETAAVSILAAIFSIFLLMLLGFGCNMVDICQLYCCCGILRHDGRDRSTDEDPQNPIVDGFVKLGDF